MPVESKVITSNHKRLEVTYDSKQFCVIRNCNGSLPNIPVATIELDLKEAQSLACFILWRGLQWR